MTLPNQPFAKRIIEEVGSNGIPPEYGYQYFTAGLDSYLRIIEDEYLKGLLPDGASFKLVVGTYGGGKTHFLYAVRDLAWKNNYIVSYIQLSPQETPFHKLELVYSAIAKNLMYPTQNPERLSSVERGLGSFLMHWVDQKQQELESNGLHGEELKEALRTYASQTIKGYESISFTRAIRLAFLSLVDGRDRDFENVLQWLTGEGYSRQIHADYGLLHKIDKSQAFPLWRSIVQWLRSIGFSGLVVLLDEAERVGSMSSRQADLLANNLRQLIDACHQTAFKGVMIVYAVPDETFLERRGRTYEALKQRVATVFETLNPMGAKLNLEKLGGENPVALLEEIGRKLTRVYEIAYGQEFPMNEVGNTISLVANASYEARYGDIGYKRLFIQAFVRALNQMKTTHKALTSDEAEALVKA